MRTLLLMLIAFTLTACPKTPDPGATPAQGTPASQGTPTATAPTATPASPASPASPTPSGTPSPAAGNGQPSAPEDGSGNQTTPEQYSQETGFDYRSRLADFGLDNLTEQRDAGQVRQGQNVSLNFLVQNLSDQEMELGPPAVSVPCCTSAHLETDALSPGEATEMPVEIRTTHQTRDFVSNIVVPYRKGEEQGSFLFRVSCYIEPIMEAEPPYLMLESSGKGSFQLNSERFSSGLEVTSIETQPEGLQVTAGEAGDSSQTFQVDASGLQEAQGGAIRLLTNDEEIPDVIVGWSRQKK